MIIDGWQTTSHGRGYGTAGDWTVAESKFPDPAGLVARLREKFPEIGETPDARTVFVKLRELRNKW